MPQNWEASLRPKKKSKLFINHELLKKWVDDHGDTGKLKLCLQSRLSLATLYQITSGDYDHELKPFYRENICKITGLKEDQLFQRKIV